MKPNTNNDDNSTDSTQLITGDTIGGTAYSQRFVLKLMLKFANLDSLKDEMQQTAFEEDLCTLWDMTTESDVVTFLQNHKILNLLNFALPEVESPRILEIIVGIIGNLCCQKEVVDELLVMEPFFTNLLEFINSDDSLVLIQVLRFSNACLFQSEDKIGKIIDVLKDIAYSEALYFILKNSTNKDLLVNALENLNTLCTYCNVDNYRSTFYEQFLKKDAIEGLVTGFTEVVVTQKDACDHEEIDRVIVITLQILLNLIGFEKSSEIFFESKSSLDNLFGTVLKHYSSKINQREIDTDFLDIIESINTIIEVFDVINCDIDVYFIPTFNIWQSLKSHTETKQNVSEFEESDLPVNNIITSVQEPLCTLLCRYINKCSEDNVEKVIVKLGNHLEELIRDLDNTNLKESILKRTDKNRSRLKDNVDS